MESAPAGATGRDLICHDGERRDVDRDDICGCAYAAGDAGGEGGLGRGKKRGAMVPALLWNGKTMAVVGEGPESVGVSGWSAVLCGWRDVVPAACFCRPADLE